MSGSQLGTHIRLFKVERHWDKDGASGRGEQSLNPSKSYVSGIRPAQSGPHTLFMTSWNSAIKCPLWQCNWFFGGGLFLLYQSVCICRCPADHKYTLQPGWCLLGCAVMGPELASLLRVSSRHPILTVVLLCCETGMISPALQAIFFPCCSSTACFPCAMLPNK